MHSEPESKWLAVNLYYNEPWEEFLVKGLKPYIDTIEQTGIAEQFYFVRYWERGPHIRLRIKGDATVLDDILKPNLEEYFLHYFDSKPSKRTDPSYPPQFPESYKWIPNNSLTYIPFDIDTLIYGGPAGVKIAEKQFYISSHLALKILWAKAEEWSYDEALGVAIKLHLSFIHTMGLSLEENIVFFDLLFKSWLPKTFRFYNSNFESSAFLKQQQKTILKFRKGFERQKNSLIPFHSALWNGLGKEGDFEDENLNYWIAAHEEIREDLSIAYELDQLSSEPGLFKYCTHLSQHQQKLWAIFADFIHQTNNRLGISQKDEGFLAFLMCESLKALLEETRQFERMRELRK